MRHFHLHRATDLADALLARRDRPGAAFIAGGTAVIDLMKHGVEAPDTLVDISRLPGLDRVETAGPVLRFGALAKMSAMAEDAVLKRDYPALSESLWRAASAQLRNMASAAGNILQRTRCPYFRDVAFACNKRAPGSGCSALDGENRGHAVLGTSSACIAAYPGDWGVALAAFDASVETLRPSGERRTVAFEGFHRSPGDTPHLETVLEPGELVTAIVVPATPAGRKSVYLKVRDRESYEFAVASAAVGLEMDGGTVRSARIALGGVATKPWRARDAERVLIGRALTEASAREAGEAALAGARGYKRNAFKIELGRRTVAEALLTAARRG